jgi:hypothetical protein
MVPDFERITSESVRAPLRHVVVVAAESFATPADLDSSSAIRVGGQDWAAATGVEPHQRQRK